MVKVHSRYSDLAKGCIRMNRTDKAPITGHANTYTGLYKAGAIAALIAAVLFRRNLDAEWMLLKGIGILYPSPPSFC